MFACRDKLKTFKDLNYFSKIKSQGCRGSSQKILSMAEPCSSLPPKKGSKLTKFDWLFYRGKSFFKM